MAIIDDYINKLIEKINDKRYYYSMDRESPFATDCSLLVISTLKDCGIPVGAATFTGNMLVEFKKTGVFQVLPFRADTMQRGDILLKHISGSNGHVVTYIGNGQIAEACNKKYGLRVTNYYANNYQYILRYSGSGSAFNVTDVPTVRKGSKNIYVGFLQLFLNKYCGCRLVVDCDAGPKSIEALKNMQLKYSLEVDGICGPKTWTKIYSIMVQSS